MEHLLGVISISFFSQVHRVYLVCANYEIKRAVV